MSQKVDITKYGFTILQIETKGACNMACQFCPYPLRQDPKSVLNEEKVYQLIDSVDVENEKFEYICFNQFNEPLMDPRIFDFVRYCADKNIRTLMVTNALLFNLEEKRRQLIESRPSIVKISLQNIDEENFNTARGTRLNVKTYFNNIYKFVNEAKDTDIEVNIDIACNFQSPIRKNIKKLLGLATGDSSVPDYLADLEQDLIDFLGGLKETNDWFNFDEKDVGKFLNEASPQYIDEVGFPITEKIRIMVKPFIYGRRISDFKKNTGKFSCTNRILGVLADGNVVPCCLAYDPDITMGSVENLGLEDILNDKSPWIDALRDINGEKHDVCRKCFGEPTSRGVFVRKIWNRIKYRA